MYFWLFVVFISVCLVCLFVYIYVCALCSIDGVMRTMNTEKLIKTLPIIQNQLDALLDFQVCVCLFVCDLTYNHTEWFLCVPSCRLADDTDHMFQIINVQRLSYLTLFVG